MPDTNFIFSLCISVSEKNNQPVLELRKIITDFDLIKYIISAAYHDKIIQIQPKFSDKIRSIGILCDKGILRYSSEDKQYYFNI